ncbi:MAG TPA: hypothetical protein VFN30_09345 [Chitinophagaceae bacterium]|nr:hypothetical protein [Chitinophagaceae bacterium]
MAKLQIVLFLGEQAGFFYLALFWLLSYSLFFSLLRDGCNN